MNNITEIFTEEEFTPSVDATVNNLSYAEIERLRAEAVAKVESYGLRALNEDERHYYGSYLLTHINKVNTKGDAVKPIHVNVADLVLLDFNVFVLNSDVYIYNETLGVYEKDEDGKRLKHQIKKYLDREFIEDKIIDSIYKLILSDASLTLSDNQVNQRPKHWIHFSNGYYDYKTDSLVDHNPNYHEISVIPWAYSPSYYPTTYKFTKKGTGILRETVETPLLFNSWLDEVIPNKDDQTMFLQYLGYAMTLDTSKQKFLMICGFGGTGKSTLLSLVESIIGKKNVSNISLQGLQERFSPGELYLKQANICADIPLSALSEVDMIKKLTGEDTISADRKFKSNFSFKSFARLFFSANDIPVNLSDKSNAFYRRMLILKMEHKPTEIDTELLAKLKTEIPNIITRAVEELYLSDGNIDESENSKENVKTAHKNSDTVEAFIDECCEIVEGIRTIRTALYSNYCNYCDSEGRKYVTPNGFYKALENKGFNQAKGKTRDFVGLRISNVIPLDKKVC